MYLQPENQKLLATLLLSTLWQDVERCMLARRPEEPDVKDPTHVSAARGHQRAGYEKFLTELKKLPLEEAPVVQDPFARPAVAFTDD